MKELAFCSLGLFFLQATTNIFLSSSTICNSCCCQPFTSPPPGQVLLLGLFTCFCQKTATCTFDDLVRVFPNLSFPTDTWAVPVPGCHCSTAIHSEAGGDAALQLLKQKQPPVSHQVFAQPHSLKVRTAKPTKAPQLFILPQISIFLSPCEKF